MTPVVHATFAFVLQACRGGLIVDLLSPRRGQDRGSRLEAATLAPGAPSSTLITISADPAGWASLCARPTTLPLASGVAGAVLLGDELWLDAAPHSVIEEAKRVLSAGGFLAVLVRTPGLAGPAEVSSDEATWWAPTPDDAGSLLRRHFPYVTTLEAVPTEGCALWSPKGEARSEHVLDVVSPRAHGQRATHLLLIATRRRRKLLEVALVRDQGAALLEDARRDLADALDAVGAARAAAEAQFLRSNDLEAERRRLATSLEVEARRASEAVRRHATLAGRVEVLEAALGSERERAAAATAELGKSKPLLARETGRATQAEAERLRLEAALARERDRREAAESGYERTEKAAVDARADALEAVDRATRFEQELVRQTARVQAAELSAVDLSEALAQARSEAARAAAALNEALRRADDLAEEVAALGLELERARSRAS